MAGWLAGGRLSRLACPCHRRGGGRPARTWPLPHRSEIMITCSRPKKKAMALISGSRVENWLSTLGLWWGPLPSFSLHLCLGVLTVQACLSSRSRALGEEHVCGASVGGGGHRQRHLRGVQQQLRQQDGLLQQQRVRDGRARTQRLVSKPPVCLLASTEMATVHSM